MSKYKVGDKIDALTILEDLGKKPYYKRTRNITTYLCECQCGNLIVRNERSLSDKDHYHNCGCITKKNLTPKDAEHMSKCGKERAKKRNKDDINVDMLFREKPISTNKSGVQGICWSKTANKWHCYIGYKKRRATLGFFEDIEDAKKIRQLALKHIKNGDFEKFFEDLRGFPIDRYVKDERTSQSKREKNKYGYNYIKPVRTTSSES